MLYWRHNIPAVWQPENYKNKGAKDMKKKYVIGLDYGTLSGRAVLVSCEDGKVLTSAVKNYEHAVMDERLPDGTEIPGGDWALQCPQDYLDVLQETVRRVMADGGVSREDVIGIGLDFTSCTMLPVDEHGNPLCEQERFAANPHAYVKLWKHHGAQPQADRISALLEKRGEINNIQYGGKISSELLLPKILQIVEEAPEVYEAADQLLEAGDWLTQKMTGGKMRSADLAGYKAMWTPGTGYPAKDFLKELSPLLENLAEEKLGEDIAMAGEATGRLTDEWAEKLGLPEGIPVAAAIIDSHAGMPGSGVSRPEQMMMVVGTSSVILALSEHGYAKNGVVSGVKDAILPDYFALESGLAAVGDMFGWFVDNAVPVEYARQAAAAGMNLHTYLSAKAEKLQPGESGLVALDWWNGNKTPYVDGRLSGMLAGCTLSTKPEEIYRALIEATAFGTRKILDLFDEAGADIRVIIASGGIAEKNPLLMQIYADVLNREIMVSDTDQTAALGSAVYASVAAGGENGGYDTIAEAVSRMSHLKDFVYRPHAGHVQRYNELYEIYCELVEMFDPGKCGVMTKLHRLRG